MGFLKLLFYAFVVLVFSSSLHAKNESEAQFFELRTYYCNEGKLEALNARFRDHSCALFEKHGMTNLGYWTPAGETDILFYLLGYPDEKSRGESWRKFLNDPLWKKAYSTSIEEGKLVSKIDSVFLQMTDYSGQPVTEGFHNQLFELRTYKTLEGRLDSLNARFRDHTCALFEKHGISNYAYFVPAKEKEGKFNTLIYLIAHENAEARSRSWEAFKADPNWLAVREKSVKSGKILIKNGVKSVLLNNTDYSPLN